MAVVPAVPLVSVDDYLSSSYHPDLEYVDGILVERGVPTTAHGILQFLLGFYLEPYRLRLHFEAMCEVRTQIIERARYRIPDIMLCPVPLPPGRVITVVPWVVIEILSPEDRMVELLARFRDYTNIGVHHMVLLDPEELTAYRPENRSLIEKQFTSLDLPTGTLPFDTDAIFRQLTERRKRLQ